MKRSASLDLLRGGAAFAVAIPHYLTANAPFQPFAEAFAIAGVEVFFVLSGFVLAPQIVDWVVDKPWRNLGVFLVRRWMRTIPPYVVALIVIAVLTGNLMTADFVRYLFYVENLFSSANHVDFYPEPGASRSRNGSMFCLLPLCSLSQGSLGDATGGSRRPSRSWSFSSWRRCGSRSRRTTGT